MDPATVLADVQIAVSIAKLAIDVGQEAAPFVENIYQIVVGKKSLTADQRALMLANEASARAKLQAPLPAEA